MLKNLYKTLMLALLIAILALFSSIQAQADSLICTDEEKANFECFESQGFIVKIVKINGSFPFINHDGDSVFQYKINGYPHKFDGHPPKIDDVLALFPVCNPELNVIGANYHFNLADPGVGDSRGRGCKTNFGTGQELFQSFQWTGFRAYAGRVTVTIEGVVGTKNGPLLLQRSCHPAGWPYGDIQLPGCQITRQGTALLRTIPLDDNNCIRVSLNPGTLCADEVLWFRNATCEGESEPIPEEEDADPIAIFSGTGNQFCPEGFRVIDVPGFSPCYEYVSGGRTRYIPSGCNK